MTTETIAYNYRSAEASSKLLPGQRVGIIDGFAYPAGSNLNLTEEVQYEGIVNPFLDKEVVPGQKFMVLLDPSTT